MASRTSKLKEEFIKLRESIKGLRHKSAYDLLIGDSLARYKRRMQKEKDELAREGRGLRTIAFILTLISMFLALSFIPFFPQPLPILVAVLVAFAVYLSPAGGMSLGCIPIVLGLLYHLSLVDFVAQLGPAVVRVLFICLLVFFFVALPIRFRRYEDAIGINLGIIAATLLFFDATFYLAIPLLLTTGILFKKTQAGLAIAYYALISVPLMVMQYYQYIQTIPRFDFWNDATTIPPIYASLAKVFTQIQGAMPQFRMFDVSQTLGRITWEVIASPPVVTHAVGQAITQYLDSFPGMIMFLVMVGGLVWVVSLVLPSFTSKSSVSQAEKIFPVLSAAGVTALFFLFLSGLQLPLAFSAKINTSRIMIGILASMAFAVPASMLNFAPKKKAEIEKNCQTILVKAGDLLTKLQAHEGLLSQVKAKTPLDVSANETKMQLIKERLDDIIAKASARQFKVPETYEKIKELDKDLADGVAGLISELELMLEHYQLTLNYSYTTWIKKLQEVGYDVKNPVKTGFEKTQTPQERIEYISSTIESSKLLANDVCALASRVYDVVKSLYDPSLPTESGTINYAKQKLREKAAPWTACEGLIIAFKNWTKQYAREIFGSRQNLQVSLEVLTKLAERDAEWQSFLGEQQQRIADEVQKAVILEANVAQMNLNILNVPAFKDALQESIGVARNVLSILQSDLAAKEASIESLQPIENGFWEKNVLLREQTESVIEQLSDFKKYNLRQMLQSLPSALSYIDPCMWTVAQYSLKNELLLNYPMAKTAIETLLKKKKHVSIQDLPFSAKDSEEYLKLFFNERNQDFVFDEENLLLTRKA